jgi:hypothetical protein
MTAEGTVGAPTCLSNRAPSWFWPTTHYAWISTYSFCYPSFLDDWGSGESFLRAAMDGQDNKSRRQLIARKRASGVRGGEKTANKQGRSFFDSGLPYVTYMGLFFWWTKSLNCAYEDHLDLLPWIIRFLPRPSLLLLLDSFFGKRKEWRGRGEGEQENKRGNIGDEGEIIAREHDLIPPGFVCAAIDRRTGVQKPWPTVQEEEKAGKEEGFFANHKLTGSFSYRARLIG